MTRKKVTVKDKIEYLIYQLTKRYALEKTEEDYEKILKGLTSDSILIDVTLKAWAKILKGIEELQIG